MGACLSVRAGAAVAAAPSPSEDGVSSVTTKVRECERSLSAGRGESEGVGERALSHFLYAVCLIGLSPQAPPTPDPPADKPKAAADIATTRKVRGKRAREERKERRESRRRFFGGGHPRRAAGRALPLSSSTSSSPLPSS
jgi:hypothetical protein